MMKPLICGINLTDFIIQLCAISDFRLLSLEIISILFIRISLKSHIGAMLIITVKAE